MRTRSIFRSRRKRPPVYLAPLAAVIAKHQAAFRPGTLTELRTWHAARCPYPRGQGECSCAESDISVEIVDALRN